MSRGARCFYCLLLSAAYKSQRNLGVSSSGGTWPSVTARCRDLAAIRREGDTADTACVAFQGSQDLPSGCMPKLPFEQAVTLPVVWTTAHYCLSEAQAHSMQRVLIHAAAGGVGLISIE